MIINDRRITITVGQSRKAVKWTPQTLLLSEFWERLHTPGRSTEAVAEYLALPKARQDDLKDVGGYVAGALSGPRRKGCAVAGRDLLTLDLDQIPAGGVQDMLRRVEGLGCGYCVHSTRKHTPGAPRLRVLLPLDRTVTADEYEPIARRMAQYIGMAFCDPSTFEPSRLMYWPSCSADSEYIYHWADKPLLSANGILAQYQDWRDWTQWPQAPGAQEAHKRDMARQAKQADPEGKQGVVGAFCRVYNVYKAMEELLPGAYEPVDGQPDRYTYTGGSTTGGAVIYDDGAFLYSHHATDPASGKLCNAFDLVRLHKFGALDDGAEVKPDTPGNRLPSYDEMKAFACSIEEVAAVLDREHYERAAKDFEGVPPEDGADASAWRKLLAKNGSGNVVKSVKNVLLALQNDPLLKGRIRLDCFADRIMGAGPLPWESRKGYQGPFIWAETDDSGLRDYIERSLGFRGKDVIDDAFLQCAAVNQYNPVDEYLERLRWDGVPRLDRLLVDYLGAEDCPYIHAVTRKAFVAAVARVKRPGVKFDVMTVICGRQGTGKTTLVIKMGKDWASNSLESFEGKDAAELLQGVWLIEIGELGALDRSQRNSVKSFLSKVEDQYRAPYARRTEKHPRRCVFFGTTNDHDYLKDPTGNRRFWPVDTSIQEPVKNVFRDLDGEVDQLWAEAAFYWRLGESLVLPAELEAEAERRRGNHMEQDPLKGQIEEFLARPVPEDWPRWDSVRRSMFWSGGVAGVGNLVHRDRVCALEIWRECLHECRAAMPRGESRRINDILDQLPGWERSTTIRCGADYGTQKGFRFIGKSVNFAGEFVNLGCVGAVNLVNEENEQGLRESLQQKPHG